MVSQKTKIFDYNGRKVQFNPIKFIEIFYRCIKEQNLKVCELELLIANEVGVTDSAVHNWRYRKNGPSDLKMIENIAKCMNIKDWTLLIKEAREENKNMKLTDIQKESVKRIYDTIIDFLFEFERTGGFTTELWIKFRDEGIKNPLNEIQEYVDKKVSLIHKQIKKENFYLRGTEIYDELTEYAYNDLYDITEGKLDYAYRFEATGGESGITTLEDYEKAMNGLDKIIFKYV